MADKRRRKTAIAALLVTIWLVITLAGVGAGTLLTSMGDLSCEADPADAPVGFRDSNYGHMAWSFVPPGPHCVWTVETNGFAASDRPSPIWSLWLLTVVALGYLAWRQLAAVASGDSPSAPPPNPSGVTERTRPRKAAL
jgi:hypothetical protein